MDRKLSINSVSRLLYPVFERYNIRQAVLFGSIAKGTSSINSDIDILVDSNLHGLQFMGFLEDVRQAADMDVDVFDVSHIEKDSLIDSEIKKTGVVIYER